VDGGYPPTFGRNRLRGLWSQIRGNNQCRKDRRVNNLNKITGMTPCDGIGKRLSENVSAHTRSSFINKEDLLHVEDLMEPGHGNTVCARQITHSRVLTSLDYAYHSLVVFVKQQGRLMWKKHLPEAK
ncbi:MAG: hypothetical protein ACKPKO_29580, partial [Candidatus Fonsibacter sp.]